MMVVVVTHARGKIGSQFRRESPISPQLHVTAAPQRCPPVPLLPGTVFCKQSPFPDSDMGMFHNIITVFHCQSICDINMTVRLMPLTQAIRRPRQENNVPQASLSHLTNPLSKEPSRRTKEKQGAGEPAEA